MKLSTAYDFDTINRLVASGARVDCYEHGHSAVHWTVRLRWFEGVRLLLQHKADANIASCRRETPLLTALRTMQYGVASLLIAARADVNATTPDGETPLHSAVCSGCGPYICRRLIDAGAAVNLVVKGATLLHDAVVCGHVATLELLLGGGADARAASFGRTPLHEAIRRGNAAAVESLLASDAALVGLVDRQGRAPLEYAYEENKPDIVRRLLLFKEELWERSAAAPHVEEINS